MHICDESLYNSACYFLPEHNILLDGGTGLYRVHKYMQTAALEIYLSHTHGDHTIGLGLLFASYFKKLLDESDLPVDEACLEGILKRSNGLLNGTRIHVTAKMLPVLQSQFIYLHDWRLLQTSEALPGGGRLSYFAFNPAREEIGFRLDWPSHSLAYVIDTIASPEATYVDKIAGVDLLLHDCNLPDSKSMLANSINHSYTSAVAQVAARAHVKHLILIHPNPVGWPIEPDLPTARNIFPATEIGRDGMEVEF